MCLHACVRAGEGEKLPNSCAFRCFIEPLELQLKHKNTRQPDIQYNVSCIIRVLLCVYLQHYLVKTIKDSSAARPFHCVSLSGVKAG